jgi:hypothetical protein
VTGLYFPFHHLRQRRIFLITQSETLAGAAFVGVIIVALPSQAGAAVLLLAAMVGITLMLLVSGS